MDATAPCDPATDVTNYSVQPGHRLNQFVPGLCDIAADYERRPAEFHLVPRPLHLPHRFPEPADGLCSCSVVGAVPDSDGAVVHRVQVFWLAGLLRKSG